MEQLKYACAQVDKGSFYEAEFALVRDTNGVQNAPSTKIYFIFLLCMCVSRSVKRTVQVCK